MIGIIDNVSGDCKHILLMGIFSPAILIFASSGRCLKHFDFKSSLNSLWGCNAVLSNLARVKKSHFSVSVLHVYCRCEYSGERILEPTVSIEKTLSFDWDTRRPGPSQASTKSVAEKHSKMTWSSRIKSCLFKYTVYCLQAARWESGSQWLCAYLSGYWPGF